MVELRTFNSLLSSVKQQFHNDENPLENKTFVISKELITNQDKLGGKDLKELKKNMRALLTFQIEIETKSEITMINAFSLANYIKDEKSVVIEVTKEFMLKCFEYYNGKGFITFLSKDMLALKSVYSLRIYELLKMQIEINERYTQNNSILKEIKELRTWFNLDKNKYPRFSNFKARIIDKAYEEITQKTDISFKYRIIRKGSIPVTIEFYDITDKANSCRTASRESTIEKTLLDFGINPSQALKISARNHPEKMIFNLIEKAKKGDIPRGLFITLYNAELMKIEEAAILNQNRELNEQRRKEKELEQKEISNKKALEISIQKEEYENLSSPEKEIITMYKNETPVLKHFSSEMAYVSIQKDIIRDSSGIIIGIQPGLSFE